MRYLRMLTNAMIGGGLLASYLTILVLQLNPRLAIAWMPALAATLVFSYGMHAVAAFYVLIVLRQLLASEVLSPGWISFRFLVWLSAVASVVGAVMMWVNLRGFRAVLDQAAVRRMTMGAAALTVCAGICVVMVIVHRWSGRRSTRAGATVLGVAVMASLAVPLILRGPGTGRARPARVPAPAVEPAPSANVSRVTLLLLEGASLDVIVPEAANGRLPHFARLLEGGASFHLATLRPTQPSTVWTAAATGKLPFKNGIRSAAMYYPLASREGLEVLPDFCFAHALVRFGFLSQRVHTSGDLTALPLWSILSSQGVSVGVVNWAVTHPVRPVLGYLVSDRYGRARGAIDLEGPESLWPAAAADAAEPVPAGAAAAAAPLVPPVPPVPAAPADESYERVTRPCDTDRAFDRMAAGLEARMPARFRAVRYECLDAVGHYYLRYTKPTAFGDVSDEELARFSSILPAQYARADAVIGREIEALAPGDLLLVVSGFGMEPIDPGKRLLERAFGNPELNGTHERAPDGFLMAFGTGVRPGHYERGAIIDLAPTILYYLGLPVGRDMDGFARTDIFARPLVAARPITYIPSYER